MNGNEIDRRIRTATHVPLKYNASVRHFSLSSQWAIDNTVRTDRSQRASRERVKYLAKYKRYPLQRVAREKKFTCSRYCSSRVRLNGAIAKRVFHLYSWRLSLLPRCSQLFLLQCEQFKDPTRFPFFLYSTSPGLLLFLQFFLWCLCFCFCFRTIFFLTKDILIKTNVVVVSSHRMENWTFIHMSCVKLITWK